MIPALAPVFAGPLRPFGERVAVGGDVPESEVVDDLAVVACLRCHAAHLRTADLRAAASAWMRDYARAIVPSALAAAVLLRRRLPFDDDAVRWTVGDDGRVASLRLPHDGESPERAALDALLRPLVDHFAQVLAWVARAARVSPRLLWCTAGVFVSGVARQLGAHPALGAAQRAALMAWVTADGNPFAGAFRPGTWPGEAPVRRICCLNHRLPDEGYCGTCPLQADRLCHSRAGGNPVSLADR